MQTSRVIATQLNALNRQMHVVVDSVAPDEWMRRPIAGTNLPAFTLWHIARVIDATVNAGLRGTPEVIASEPWASSAWARRELGTGFSLQEADDLAGQVVPGEVLAYADALRTQVNQWLRALPDEELEAPARLLDNMRKTPAYATPAVLEAIAGFDGQPAWIVLTLACFAHGWAHLEEIGLLTGASRSGGG